MGSKEMCHYERKVAPDGLKTLHYVFITPVLHHSNAPFRAKFVSSDQ